MTTPSARSDKKAPAQKLDKYFERLAAHLPRWLAAAFDWLRQPERLLIRGVVAALLIIGGLLSFLPVLGIWMLPLGLIIIAQDLPFLQRPLVRFFEWAERRWQRWRGRR